MKQYLSSISKLFVCVALVSLSSCSTTKQGHIRRMKTPKQGLAILEGYKYYAKATWAWYTLVTDDGKSVEHIANLQLLDGPFSSNYNGCEFVCWYDADDPEEIYVCQDSMIVDTMPVIILEAQLNHVQKVKGYTRLTYQFEYDSSVFEWMESLPLSEYDRYRQMLSSQTPITIGLYRHPSKERVGIPRVSR